jgi:hypothetical protein
MFRIQLLVSICVFGSLSLFYKIPRNDTGRLMTVKHDRTSLIGCYDISINKRENSSLETKNLNNCKRKCCPTAASIL